MRLKYKILWFEDDEDVVNEDVGPVIKDILTALGFEPVITHHLNGEHLEGILQDKNYDLIVTDLNLGDHETGQQLIEQIRSGKILTEVLLYSANAGDLSRVLEKSGWVERASFCVGLANLTNKLKEIILLTVRKNQDVNNIRGLVIAETIYLEHKIENILLDYFGADAEKILDEKKSELLQNIHAKKVTKHESDLEVIKGIKFSEIKSLMEKDILTASNSLDALQSILKQRITDINKELGAGNIELEAKTRLEEKRDELKTVKTELNNFGTEILKVRNTLAHVIEELGEDGLPFLKSLNTDGTHITFNHEKYVEIRSNLMKHNDNLEKILNHLLEI